MNAGTENIEGLRTHLFDAMAQLKNGKIDVATAKAVSDIGQTIINTAKVEIDFAKAMQTEVGTSFIPRRVEALPMPAQAPAPTQLADTNEPAPEPRPLPTPAQVQAGPFGAKLQRLTAEDTPLPKGITGVTRHTMGD